MRTVRGSNLFSDKNLAIGTRGLLHVGVAVILCICVGCLGQSPGTDSDVYIWGKRGITKGRLQKPRAVAIDADDHLYVVDMTARIQVFDSDGKYLRGWKTPASKNGRPSGLSFDRRGRLLVADTHYYQMLVYQPSGEM